MSHNPSRASPSRRMWRKLSSIHAHRCQRMSQFSECFGMGRRQGHDLDAENRINTLGMGEQSRHLPAVADRRCNRACAAGDSSLVEKLKFAPGCARRARALHCLCLVVSHRSGSTATCDLKFEGGSRIQGAPAHVLVLDLEGQSYIFRWLMSTQHHRRLIGQFLVACFDLRFFGRSPRPISQPF